MKYLGQKSPVKYMYIDANALKNLDMPLLLIWRLTINFIWNW